jgi:hypothetical protein
MNEVLHAILENVLDPDATPEDLETYRALLSDPDKLKALAADLGVSADESFRGDDYTTGWGHVLRQRYND